MTDARDELALLIGRCVDRHLPGIPMGPVQSFMVATADAILAAGWRAPLPSAPDCNHHGRWRAGACVDCGVQCEHRHVTHAKRCGTCGESQLTLDEALERAHRLSGW